MPIDLAHLASSRAPLRLPARLDPVRRPHHPLAGARRPARHRLGQYRRHQRAADRQQGPRGADAARRRAARARSRCVARAFRRAETRRWSAGSPPSSATLSRSGSASGAARASRPISACLLGLAWPSALAFAGVWLAVACSAGYSSLAALIARHSTPGRAAGSARSAARLFLGAHRRAAVLHAARQHRAAVAGTEGRIGEDGVSVMADRAHRRAAPRLAPADPSENVGPRTFRGLSEPLRRRAGGARRAAGTREARRRAAHPHLLGRRGAEREEAEQLHRMGGG